MKTAAPVRSSTPSPAPTPAISSAAAPPTASKPVGDAASFTINANTGAVTLTGNPNFEAKPSYNFTVVATDGGGNSDEQAVTLAINNLDEVAPTITSGATATAITENSGAGQVVYTVTSTDTGDISTGSTTYSLKAGGDAAAFSINASTGDVTLTGNPDFETKSSYAFTVVATDAASNHSEQAVSLAINNIVDETPPAVANVALTGAVGAQNGILNAGDTVSVTVTMTENTTGRYVRRHPAHRAFHRRRQSRSGLCLRQRHHQSDFRIHDSAGSNRQQRHQHPGQHAGA